jgi:hypothetical protein
MFTNALLDAMAMKRPETGDWATWFGGFTTFAALWMTIRLATADRRTRERTERAQAVVSAATFEIELADCITSIESALAFLRSYNEGAGVGAALKGCDMIVKATPLRSHDVAQLIAIAPALAVELARAGSVLARIQMAVLRPSNPFLPEDAGRIVEFMSKEQACKDLVASLWRCVEACRKAQTLLID